jgi:hypothetical protein
MPKPIINQEAIYKKVVSIESLLQDKLIIQCSQVGISKGQTRTIVGVADAKVSRIWKNIKVNTSE